MIPAIEEITDAARAPEFNRAGSIKKINDNTNIDPKVLEHFSMDDLLFLEDKTTDPGWLSMFKVGDGTLLATSLIVLFSVNGWLPNSLAAVGILVSILGYAQIRSAERGNEEAVQQATSAAAGAIPEGTVLEINHLQR